MKMKRIQYCFDTNWWIRNGEKFHRKVLICRQHSMVNRYKLNSEIYLTTKKKEFISLMGKLHLKNWKMSEHGESNENDNRINSGNSAFDWEIFDVLCKDGNLDRAEVSMNWSKLNFFFICECIATFDANCISRKLFNRHSKCIGRLDVMCVPLNRMHVSAISSKWNVVFIHVRSGIR